MKGMMMRKMGKMWVKRRLKRMTERMTGTRGMKMRKMGMKVTVRMKRMGTMKMMKMRGMRRMGMMRTRGPRQRTRRIVTQAPSQGLSPVSLLCLPGKQ